MVVSPLVGSLPAFALRSEALKLIILLNPYPTKLGFFCPEASYRTKKGILLFVLKNKFLIRHFQ